MTQHKTFEEMTIEERRALQGKGRPNMARVKECVLGIHGTADRARIESFLAELGRTHVTPMHDYILDLESRVAELEQQVKGLSGQAP